MLWHQWSCFVWSSQRIYFCTCTIRVHFALSNRNNFDCKFFARINKKTSAEKPCRRFFIFCSLLPQSLTKSQSTICGWFSKKSLGNVLNNSRVDTLTPAIISGQLFAAFVFYQRHSFLYFISARTLSAGFLHRQNDVGIRIFAWPSLLNSAK